MNALRQIYQTDTDTITVKLPAEFKKKTVEIILLVVDDKENQRARLRELLLHAPVISAADVKRYRDARKWMNKWSIKTF